MPKNVKKDKAQQVAVRQASSSSNKRAVAKQDQPVLDIAAANSEAPGAFDLSSLGWISKLLGKKFDAHIATARSFVSAIFFAAGEIESYGEGKHVNNDMRHLVMVEFALLLQLMEVQSLKCVAKLKSMLTKDKMDVVLQKTELSEYVDKVMVVGLRTDFAKVAPENLDYKNLTERYKKLKAICSLTDLETVLYAQCDNDDEKMEIRTFFRTIENEKGFEEFLTFCIEQYKAIYEPYLEKMQQHREKYTKKRQQVDESESYSDDDFAVFRTAILTRQECTSWLIKARLMAIKHDMPLYPELKEYIQRFYSSRLRDLNLGARYIAETKGNSMASVFQGFASSLSDESAKEDFLTILRPFIKYSESKRIDWTEYAFNDLKLSQSTVKEYAQQAFAIDAGMTVNQYCIGRMFQLAEINASDSLRFDLTQQATIPQGHRFITKEKKRWMVLQLTEFAKQAGLLSTLLSVADYNQQQKEGYIDNLHAVNDLLRDYLNEDAEIIGRMDLIKVIGKLEDVVEFANRQGVSTNQFVLQKFAKHYQANIDMTNFFGKTFFDILQFFMQQLEQRQIHIELFEDDVNSVDDYKKALHLRTIRAIYPYLCQIGLSIDTHVDMSSPAVVSGMYDGLCKRAKSQGYPAEDLIIPTFLDLAQEKYIAVDFSNLPAEISEDFSAVLRSILTFELDQWTAKENCDIYYFLEEQLRYCFDNEFSGYTPFSKFIADYEIRRTQSNFEKTEKVRRAQTALGERSAKYENALMMLHARQELVLVPGADVRPEERELTVEERSFLYSREEELKAKFIDKVYGEADYEKHNPLNFSSEEEQITAKQQALVRCEELLVEYKDRWSVEDFVAFHATAKWLLNYHRNEIWDSVVNKPQAKTWKHFLPGLQAAMLATVERENGQLKETDSIDARRAMLEFVRDLELFAGDKQAETKLVYLIEILPYPVSSAARDAFQQKLAIFKAGPLKDVDLVTQRKGLSKKFEAFTGDFTTIEEFVLFFDAIGYRHDGKTAGEDTEGLTLLRKENRSASAWGGQFGHTKTSQGIAEKAIEQLKALLGEQNSEVTPEQDAMCRYVLNMKIARGPGNKKAKANIKWYENKVKVVENADVQQGRASEEVSASTPALVPG